MFIDRGIASEQLGFLQRANADKTFGAIGDWWVPKATTHYTLFAKEGDSKEARISQQAKWQVNANFTDRGHMPCFEVCPRTWPHVFMYDFFVLGYFKPMLFSLFFLSITMLRPASLDGKAWYVVSMLIGQFIDSWTEGQPIALDRDAYDGEIADGMSVGGFVDWCRIHEASCGRSVTPLEEAPAAARDPERGGSDAVTNPLQKRTMVGPVAQTVPAIAELVSAEAAPPMEPAGPPPDVVQLEPSGPPPPAAASSASMASATAAGEGSGVVQSNSDANGQGS